MICRLCFQAGFELRSVHRAIFLRAEEQPVQRPIPAPETGVVKPASEPQPQSATPPAREAVAAKPASEPAQPAANAVAQAPVSTQAEAVRKALSALAAAKTGRGAQRARGAFGILRSARLRSALAGPAWCTHTPGKRESSPRLGAPASGGSTPAISPCMPWMRYLHRLKPSPRMKSKFP